MEDETTNNKMPENALTRAANEHRGEIALEQRMDLAEHRREEEEGVVKESTAELRDGNMDKGAIGKFREIVTKNKLLRGAVIAGALLAAEPALGQMAINSKQIETAMMNFASGLRKSPQSAEEKFVQGINNPHSVENNTDSKGSVTIGDRINLKSIARKSSVDNTKKMPIGRLNLKSTVRELYNSKHDKNVRIIKLEENPILQMRMQELQQNLLQNNYNFPKSNMNISPDANIGNVNVNSGARVEVGPNAQAGSIEAEEGADVQIGTARY